MNIFKRKKIELIMIIKISIFVIFFSWLNRFVFCSLFLLNFSYHYQRKYFIIIMIINRLLDLTHTKKHEWNNNRTNYAYQSIRFAFFSIPFHHLIISCFFSMKIFKKFQKKRIVHFQFFVFADSLNIIIIIVYLMITEIILF